MKNKKWLFVALLSGFTVVQAQIQNPAYLSYIDAWKETAVANQADYGIPASIIMAQALLESAAGKSELAVNARNHFGIKCNSEWFGGVYYYDDDSKGECFRQYSDAAESFKDHALFLQRPRYATCFEIAVQDYEGWARRLKECGYATDPRYASKLVKLIEDYRLDTLATVSTAHRAQSADRVSPAGVAAGNGKHPLKAEVVKKADPVKVITADPEPPYVAPLTAREEKEQFMLAHPQQKCNGVAYVTAREGDTYANVAFRLNVRERDLREHNDALGRELEVGDRIYLSAKKKSSTNTYVWSHPGQSLWQMSQEEGVTINAIQQYNGLNPQVRTFTTRQRIYLKKVKDNGNVR
jgi:hypothetical protein